MNLYLLPWGEDQPGHFRLEGVEQLDGTGIPYAALDFRSPANKTTAGGVGIVATDGLLDVSGIGNGRLLGAGWDATIPNLVRTFLRNRLGLASGEDDATPRGLIRRLLLEHGREDGTRWRPLQPYRADRFDIFEVVLNGERVFRQAVPVISGGADYTESFTGSDGDLDTATVDLDWEVLIGTWNVAGNTAQHQGGANDEFARANSDAATADQYAQATVSGTTTSSLDRGGVTLQEQSASSTTATNYNAFIRGDGLLVLEETTSGSGSELANASPGYTSGTLIRLERNGSGLVVKYGGTTYITTSDSTLTANRRGGIYGKVNSGPLIKIDQWAFGDYVAPVEPRPTVVATANAAVSDRSPSLTFSGYTPQLNDLVVIFPSSTTTATITIPSGWVNPLGGTTDVESDAHELCCVYHLVTQAEVDAATTTYTATNLYDATETGDVNGVVVRNVDPADPIDSSNSTFDSANTVTPHVLASLTGTNLENDSLVISCVAKDATGAYSTAPTGWTFQATSNNNQGKALLSRDAYTVAGTNVSATNITPSAGDEYASITLALTMKRLPRGVRPGLVSARPWPGARPMATPMAV